MGKMVIKRWIAFVAVIAMMITLLPMCSDKAFADELPEFIGDSKESELLADATNGIEFDMWFYLCDLEGQKNLDNYLSFSISNTTNFYWDGTVDCDLGEIGEIIVASQDINSKGLYQCQVNMLYDSTGSGDFENAQIISTASIRLMVYDSEDSPSLTFVDDNDKEIEENTSFDLGTLTEGYTQQEADGLAKVFKIKNTGNIDLYAKNNWAELSGSPKVYDWFDCISGEEVPITIAAGETISTNPIKPALDSDPGTYTAEVSFCDEFELAETKYLVVTYTVISEEEAEKEQAIKNAQDTLTTADELKEEEYTAESFAAVTQAKNNLQSILNDVTATSTQIKTATESLKAAIAGLKPKTTPSAKKANTLKVQFKNKKLKVKKIKKKAHTYKAVTIAQKGQGDLKYTVKPLNKKSKKALKFNTKTGKIKVKKKTKKGTYKIKITVWATGNSAYNASNKFTKTIKIKVK